MIRKIIKFIVLSTIGIILAVSFAEMFLRIYHFIRKDQTTIVWQPDPYVGQRLKPNQNGLFVSPKGEYKTQISVNNSGWRDVNHTINKQDNTYRILFLGDSFVENFQVPLDKTFFRQVQANIPNIKGKNIEVIATGLGNTGTAQQLLLLENYSLAYKPDLVIQMFLTSNDVANNSPVLQNDPYMPYFKLDGSQLVKIPFIARSARSMSKFKDIVKTFQLTNLLLSVRQSLVERNNATKFGYPIDYHIYDTDYSEDYKKAWEVTYALISRTKQEVENSGGKYVLVTLANNEQVNKNVWNEALKTYPRMDNSKMDLEKPDKIVSNFCNEQKITCWQMLPYFQKFIDFNPRSVTHFHYDGHWNQLGTNLAADFLTQNLRDYFSTK